MLDIFIRLLATHDEVVMVARTSREKSLFALKIVLIRQIQGGAGMFSFIL